LLLLGFGIINSAFYQGDILFIYAIIYYGFGLGMYQYTGASYSLLIGLALAVLQGWFSSWWMKRHKRGPLETLWHKATWFF
jgi:uncharacterized protein